MLLNYERNGSKLTWPVVMHENIGVSVECYKLILMYVEIFKLEYEKKTSTYRYNTLAVRQDKDADGKRMRDLDARIAADTKAIDAYKLTPFENITKIRRISIKDMDVWKEISDFNTILYIFNICKLRVPNDEQLLIKEFKEHNEFKTKRKVDQGNEAISYKAYKIIQEIIIELRNNEIHITDRARVIIESLKDSLFLIMVDGGLLNKLVKKSYEYQMHGSEYFVKTHGENPVKNRAKVLNKSICGFFTQLYETKRFMDFVENMPNMKYTRIKDSHNAICDDFTVRVEILIEVCNKISEFSKKHIPCFTRLDLRNVISSFGITEPDTIVSDAISHITDWDADNSDIIRTLLRKDFITDRGIVDLYETITRIIITLSTPKHVISIDACSMVEDTCEDDATNPADRAINIATKIYIGNVIRFCNFTRDRLYTALDLIRSTVNIDNLSIIYQDVRIKTNLDKFMPISTTTPHRFQVLYLEALIAYMYNNALYKHGFIKFAKTNMIEILNRYRDPSSPVITEFSNNANIDADIVSECKEWYIRMTNIETMDELETLVLGREDIDDKIAEKYKLQPQSASIMFSHIRKHLRDNHTSNTTRLLPLEGITGGGKTVAAMMAAVLPIKLNGSLGITYIFAYVTENKQNRESFVKNVSNVISNVLRYDAEFTDKRDPWDKDISTVLVMDGAAAIAFVRDKRYENHRQNIRKHWEVIFFVDEPTEGCSKFVAENTGISLTQFSNITTFLALCKAKLITPASATMPLDHSYRVLRALMGDRAAFITLLGKPTERGRNVIWYQNNDLNDMTVHIACSIVSPDNQILLPWYGIDNYIEFVILLQKIMRNPLYRRFMSPSTQNILSMNYTSSDNMRVMLNHRNYGHTSADYSTAYATRLAYYYMTLKMYINNGVELLESSPCNAICDQRRDKALRVNTDERRSESNLTNLPNAIKSVEEYVADKIRANIVYLEKTIILYICGTNSQEINAKMNQSCPSLSHNLNILESYKSGTMCMLHDIKDTFMVISQLLNMRNLPSIIYIDYKPYLSTIFTNEYPVDMPSSLYNAIYNTEPNGELYKYTKTPEGHITHSYNLYFQQILRMDGTFYTINGDEQIRAIDPNVYTNDITIYTNFKTYKTFRCKYADITAKISGALKSLEGTVPVNGYFCVYNVKVMEEQNAQDMMEADLKSDDEEVDTKKKYKWITEQFIVPCGKHVPDNYGPDAYYSIDIVSCISFPMSFAAFKHRFNVVYEYRFKIFKPSQIAMARKIDPNNMVPLLFGMYKYTTDLDSIRSNLASEGIILHTIFGMANVMTGTDMVAEEVVITDTVANNVSELDIIQGSGRSGRKGRSSKASLVISNFTFTRLQCYMLYGQEIMGGFYALFDDKTPVINGIYANIYQKFENYSDLHSLFSQLASTNEIYNLKRIMLLLEDSRSLNVLDRYKFPEPELKNTNIDTQTSYEWLNAHMRSFRFYLDGYILDRTISDKITKLFADLEDSIDKMRKIRERDVNRRGKVVNIAEHAETISRENAIALLYQLINCIFSIIDHKAIIHKIEDMTEYDKNFNYYVLIRNMQNMLNSLEKELKTTANNSDSANLLVKVREKPVYDKSTNLCKELCNFVRYNINPSIIFFAIRAGIYVNEVFDFFDSRDIITSSKLSEAFFLASLRSQTNSKLGIIGYYILLTRPLYPMRNYKYSVPTSPEELVKVINYYYTKDQVDITIQEKISITIENATIMWNGRDFDDNYRRLVCNLLYQ